MNDTVLVSIVRKKLLDAALSGSKESYDRIGKYLDANNRLTAPIDVNSRSFESVWEYKGCLVLLKLHPFTYPVKNSGKDRYKEPLPVSPEIESDFLICRRTEEMFDAVEDILYKCSLDAIRISFPSLYKLMGKEKKALEDKTKGETFSMEELRQLYDRTEECCNRFGLLDCFGGVL